MRIFKAPPDFVGEFLRSHLIYEPVTGIMWWSVPRKSLPIGSLVVSMTPTGYYFLSFKCKNYLVHRIAWFLHHGTWPVHTIDHINGDKTDNRICNLRDVPDAENIRNRTKLNQQPRSGLVGAHVNSGNNNTPWAASIKVNGKRTNLGKFKTKEEAHAAYMVAFAQQVQS